MWSHNGQINEEYLCFVGDVQGVERNITIFDSGCSRHMFSDWRVFKNLSTDVDLWVKCANVSLTRFSALVMWVFFGEYCWYLN